MEDRRKSLLRRLLPVAVLIGVAWAAARFSSPVRARMAECRKLMGQPGGPFAALEESLDTIAAQNRRMLELLESRQTVSQ